MPNTVSNTITVNPGQSISAAIARAMPGDTVLIKNGTYREAITVARSGQSGQLITIAAEMLGQVIIDAAGLAFGINGQSASYITLRGVKIVNTNSGLQGNNAALRTGPHWCVEDVLVDRAAGCGIGILGDDATFTRVTASNCGQIGWGGWANRSLLKDCSAIGNNTSKINPAWEAGGVKFYITSGVIVDGGTWANNGGPAIWFDYRNTNYTVRNTEVYGNHGWNQSWAGAGIVAEISEGPGLIEHNYVHDNTGDGIAAWESMNVTIRDNRLLNDDIGWRDMTNRGPYRTKNNTVIGNQLTGGQIKTPPAGANNVVTTLIVPTAPPAPAQPASVDGTTVPPAAAIIDAQGVRWTLANGKISRNGVLDGVTNGVQLLLAWSGVLYQQAFSGWWKAGGAAGQWTAASDPRPTSPAQPPTEGPAQPPAQSPDAQLEAQVVELKGQVKELRDAVAGARVVAVTVAFAGGQKLELAAPAANTGANTDANTDANTKQPLAKEVGA